MLLLPLHDLHLDIVPKIIARASPIRKSGLYRLLHLQKLGIRLTDDIVNFGQERFADDTLTPLVSNYRINQNPQTSPKSYELTSQLSLILLKNLSRIGQLLQLMYGQFMEKMFGLTHQFLRFKIKGQFSLIN